MGVQRLHQGLLARATEGPQGRACAAGAPGSREARRGFGSSSGGVANAEAASGVVQGKVISSNREGIDVDREPMEDQERHPEDRRRRR